MLSPIVALYYVASLRRDATIVRDRYSTFAQCRDSAWRGDGDAMEGVR